MRPIPRTLRRATLLPILAAAVAVTALSGCEAGYYGDDGYYYGHHRSYDRYNHDRYNHDRYYRRGNCDRDDYDCR